MRTIAFLHGRASRQRGTALVISLVVLVLLTILGVSALNMTNLRSLITRNDQQKQQAFEAAESALAIGLKAAEALVVPPIANGVLADGSSYPGIYYSADATLYKAISDINWTSSDSVAAGDGRYIIEYLGERSPAGGADTDRDKVLYYRVVAQSSAGGLGTNTLLEGTLGVYKAAY